MGMHGVHRSCLQQVKDLWGGGWGGGRVREWGGEEWGGRWVITC